MTNQAAPDSLPEIQFEIRYTAFPKLRRILLAKGKKLFLNVKN